ncbi:MAG TPA: hypothetical protein VGG28_13100 [Kofleriaceae bacterium]|jgi:hypothetical protein
MRLLAVLPILAACTTSDTEAPTPDDGAYQRFVVDDFTFPTSQAQFMSLGSDLNGDGNVDNAIGEAIDALQAEFDIRDDASIRALLGSGDVPSSLELFSSDPNQIVGLQYFATQTDGGAVLRGTAVDAGGFATVGLQQGTVTLLLPALVDTGPTPITLDYTQMQLVPDGSGAYEVGVQGLVEPTVAADAVCASLLDMIATNPSAHEGMVRILDDDFDGSDPTPPTMAGCLASGTIATLLAPDVVGPDKQPYISLGIALHVFTPRNVPPFE